ncbi:MAG: 16S rRNA (guanine(527)-N(7))-methyltransferase RsmG [Acidobacteria bacterium RIFCSPLOWO2_02_FULL_68_18]|nr:MAG: 16S rRNA (guanine(527)-N(7))-methyltransferase RsmG [Acidobacteria bacterium RIFCSPLOWO2_02_FULL_68_18]OFW49643.1 MAG: 16S rRNA (guanine(527)-N(7))-methyltransferase RsmG [Acidobacteria bacterium RIFCSPLOWO2_12_FULL_68_19]
MTTREFQDRFTRRARRAGLSVAPELTARLEAYYRLLTAWNTKINLTGLKLAEFSPEALDRLLIEPLVAAKYVAGNAARMLDIGSGGGSPAIPLALAVTRLRLLMVESKTRKAVFLREAIRALEMSGAEVVTARFEELLTRPDLHEAHDLMTVRAVRVETRTLMALQAFAKPGGQLFLFRGSVTADPSETVTPPLVWRATYPLLESLRSRLVVLEKRPVGRGVPRGTPQPR